MINLFENLLGDFLKAKGFVKTNSANENHALYKNQDFTIEFIYDYRFDELGGNFLNHNTQRSLTYQDCYEMIKGKEFRNMEFLMKDLSNSSKIDLLKKSVEITSNSISINSILIVLKEHYDEVKLIVQNLV